MKIKSGYMLNTVGSENIVIPTENRTKELNGMIRLNSTGAFLWKLMQEEYTADALASALIKEYDITEETAKNAVASFEKTLLNANLLE